MKKAEIKKESNIENKKLIDNTNFLEDYEDLINSNKLSTFSTHNPNQFFRSLANPRFLGSYHMKKSILNKNKNINNILKGNLELRYTKSLRSIVFNPITITLIILAVLFNFLWFIYTLS
ncbi:MAG: hypothetical protein EU542_03230 [Promethearchaeota archaeon]|nr:MAG: hypothetical protein EU542_03230 [Candidatus Lokiarchaeota archaeon]